MNGVKISSGQNNRIGAWWDIGKVMLMLMSSIFQQ